MPITTCLKKILTLQIPIFCAFLLLLTGCYTQIASFQNETMPSDGSTVVNKKCEDCRDEVPPSAKREICVWERDIFGFPEMRCYTTNYSSGWFYFHNTPWWYRNNYRWYDSRGCPPYYYYDRSTGVCRYYGGSYRPPSGGGSGGGGGGVSAPSTPPRRSSRAAHEEAAPPEYVSQQDSGPMFTGGVKQLSPTGSPSSPPPQNQNPGLSKPQDGSGQEQQAQQQPPSQQHPPAAEPPSSQKPRDEAQQATPPTRSSRVRK